MDNFFIPHHRRRQAYCRICDRTFETKQSNSKYCLKCKKKALSQHGKARYETRKTNNYQVVSKNKETIEQSIEQYKQKINKG